MEDNCKISRWDILKRQLKNLNPEEFRDFIARDPSAHLIDCRRATEYAYEFLEGAKNLDYLGDTFYDEMDALDPEATYLVYCRSGRRSIRTCILMQNGGFSNIYNLDGGLKAWKERLGEEGITSLAV